MIIYGFQKMKILFMKVMNIFKGDFTWIEIDECDIDDMKGIGNRIKKKYMVFGLYDKKKIDKIKF